MKHKDKLKLARQHMTKLEVKYKVSPFQSKWWEARKARIEREVVKREYNQQKNK